MTLAVDGKGAVKQRFHLNKQPFLASGLLIVDRP